MTETENNQFVKYRLTWKFTDEGEEHDSEFYLPKGEDPHGTVGSILSVVEMSASEYGYEYDLTAECWRLDDDYILNLREENNDDQANAYENKCGWLKTCATCFWGDGDSCTKTQDGELVKLAEDDKSPTRESIDAMWADLRRRIQESDEPIKVTGIIGKLNQVEDERLRKESIQESEALGDA